jgi:hypothetical protein
LMPTLIRVKLHKTEKTILSLGGCWVSDGYLLSPVFLETQNWAEALWVQMTATDLRHGAGALCLFLQNAGKREHKSGFHYRAHVQNPTQLLRTVTQDTLLSEIFPGERITPHSIPCKWPQGHSCPC